MLPSLRPLSTSILRLPSSSTPITTQTSKPPIRKMSAPPKPKPEWLIILPDHADALATRMSVRPQHLQNLAPGVEAGFWTMGGAILSEPLADLAAPKIEASVMLASAETREEVVEQLRRDTYFTSGVWDWDKVVVYPFKSAIRKEL